jgi:hypothetical protein
VLASPHKVEVDAVFEDSEPIPLEGGLLTLIGDISNRPERISAPFTLCVHIASAKPHAYRDIVKVLYRQSMKLRVLIDNFAHYLQLIICITLNVGLKGLLHDDLI